jgi:mannosyltransferase
VPILLITLLGAALRFYHLGHQGIWYDESYTFELIRLSFHRMLDEIPHTESTPPLYYCLTWFWTRIFGFGAAGVRSLSAVCGTATIPVVYVAARKLLHGDRAALIAAALTACNPLLIWYSQEARSYEMLVLLSACTLATFAYARERPQPLTVALWGFACCLALTTHYFAILLVAPQAAWLIYEHRYPRNVQVAIGVLIVLCLALAPLAHEQSASGNNVWISHTSLGLRLNQVIPIFLLGPQTPARTVLKWAAFAAALAALALLWRYSRRRERQGALLPAGIALTGFVLSLLIVPVSDTFLTLNLIELWLPAALVVAAGLGVARARVLGGALTLVLCTIGVIAVIGVASDYYLGRPNWQRVAQIIGPLPRHGRRVILVLRNAGGPPLAVFLPHLKYMNELEVTGISQVDLIAVRDVRHLGDFCWWGSACNLSPSKLPPRNRLHGFHVASLHRFEQFWVEKLVANHPIRVTRAAIALDLHHPELKHDDLLLET